MSTCGADTLVREKLRSEKNAGTESFERVRLQPGRTGTQNFGALAPEGGDRQ
jgi:hypothetical protein